MTGISWIKITTDIFDDEKIQVIETLPDADSIIVIWFKLLTLAGRTNNNGIFMFANRMPYTDEMLAAVFRRPLNTIRFALETFRKFGMIEIIEDVVTIPNWAKYQNTDAMQQIKEKNAVRQRRYRANQELLELENAEPKKKFQKPTVEEIKQFCSEKNINIDAEKFWNYYESKGWLVGRSPMKSWTAAVRNWAKNQTLYGSKTSLVDGADTVNSEVTF